VPKNVTLSLFVALALLGCSGDPAPPSKSFQKTPGGFCDAKPIFEASCGKNSTCHAPDPTDPSKAILGNVDLVSPGVEQRLINQPTRYSGSGYEGVTGCPTDHPELEIDSKNTANSLLLLTLENQQACGRKMPYAPDPSFTSADIQCIRDWVSGIVAQAAGAGGSGGAP
jgi:hypothetical protein